MGASPCLNLTDLCIYNDPDQVRVLSNIVHIAKCKILEGKLRLACSLLSSQVFSQTREYLRSVSQQTREFLRSVSQQTRNA